jgi:hypothetical protein
MLTIYSKNNRITTFNINDVVVCDIHDILYIKAENNAYDVIKNIFRSDTIPIVSIFKANVNVMFWYGDIAKTIILNLNLRFNI